MSSVKFRLRGSFLAVLAVCLVWIGCTDKRADLTSPADLGPNILVVDQVALSHAIRVQKAHTDEMFEIAGVVGTGVGLTADGQLAVKIFTREAGVAGLPESLEGVPVAVEVTGMIFALRALADPTDKFAWPVPIGVSTGHPDITAGTIGARVTDGTDVFALSNNHIYANANAASIGDNALQPGPFDGGTDPDDAIGTLFAFEPIKFAKRNKIPTNTMDAAIVKSSTVMLGYATPDATPGGAYAPSSTIASAYATQQVKKYGRTTGLTSGQVSEISVTVNVCYEGFVRCTKWARFEDQIAITDGDFSGGGDSGSLIVTQTGNNPVALLFAGSSTHTIASPIGPILERFNVTIDDGAAAATNNPPSADAGGSYSGSEDAAITFDGSGSDPDNDPLTYTWDFGDGTTGSGQTASHAYSYGDTFTVTLTVTDDKGGSASDTTTATVTEVNDRPVADPNGPYSGTVGEAITFDGSGSSDFDNEDGTTANDQTLTYSWNFGDGSTASSATPTHSYGSAGDYTVTLVVNDGVVDSELASTTAIVSVPSEGVDVISIDPNFMDAGTSKDVTISGSGFADGAEVTFENGSGPTPTASNVVVVDGNTITATVTAKGGGPRGDRVWDVRVTVDSSSDVLPGGFTVTRQ